jgi:multiple antibiotic resistance protein
MWSWLKSASMKCFFKKAVSSRFFFMSLFTTTLSMFLIMNSVGHIMAYLGLVETLNEKRRQLIIIREMFFALLIMVFFHFVGGFLLDALEVSPQTTSLAGGLILFLIAIRMIFPRTKPQDPISDTLEPFIFPIATPMIAGPSILTTIMLYTYQDQTGYRVITAIMIAWAFSITILFFAQEIRNLVGRRTLIAVERLMGLLLTMMAVEMLLNGLRSIIIGGIV